MNEIIANYIANLVILDGSFADYDEETQVLTVIVDDWYGELSIGKVSVVS